MTVGETLTVAQLTGLTFQADGGILLAELDPQLPSHRSIPFKSTVSGSATLAIAAANTTSTALTTTAASLTVAEVGNGQSSPLTDQAALQTPLLTHPHGQG